MNPVENYLRQILLNSFCDLREKIDVTMMSLRNQLKIALKNSNSDDRSVFALIGFHFHENMEMICILYVLKRIA